MWIWIRIRNADPIPDLTSSKCSNYTPIFDKVTEKKNVPFWHFLFIRRTFADWQSEIVHNVAIIKDRCTYFLLEYVILSNGIRIQFCFPQISGSRSPLNDSDTQGALYAQWPVALNIGFFSFFPILVFARLQLAVCLFLLYSELHELNVLV